MLQKIRYFFYRLKYQHGQSLPLKAPVDVSLELSSTCDMACEYCYHSDQQNLPFTKGIMHKSVALGVLTQAANLGVNSLKFNFRGEGTINPHYREITQYAKSLAHGSTFIDRLANSNFKFHPRRRDDIFEGLSALTKVKVSYDSFDAKVFETQRKGGNHSLTTKNIDLFYNHPSRIKSNTQMVIQAVRTKLNRDEDIAGLAAKRWPSATISIRDMVEGRVDKDLSGLTNRTRAIDRTPCKQAFVRIIVHWDGRCGPCCPSIKNDLIIGDIRVTPLATVFNGEIARQLRADLKSGKAFESNPCSGCSSFESYKGFKPSWDS